MALGPRKKTDTPTSLANAKAALAATNARLAELAKDREGALIASDDDDAVLEVDRQISELERVARTQADRVRLLEVVVRKEEAERQAKRRADLIQRVESKLAEADNLATAVTEHLAKAIEATERLIALREQAAAAWPFDVNLQRAAALTNASIMELIQYELYRLGARPFRGGNPLEKPRQSFPGGRAPTIQLGGQPEKIQSLADAMKAATKYASDVMRARTVPLPPEPPASAAPAPSTESPAASPPDPAPKTRTAAEIQATLPKRQLTY